MKCSTYDNDFFFTIQQLRKYIMPLKLGGSCGVDGISPEHVKYAVDSDIITHLC